MSQTARVTSIGALEDLRVALLTFAGEAKESLYDVEAEVRRTLEWLDDQLKSWQTDVRHSEDAVFQAKQELSRRKLLRIGDRPPDTTEQEEALALARARLRHAEDQVDLTRRWLRQLPTAITEYQGPARLLMGMVEGEVPRACALLERKITTLEAYVALPAQVRPAAPSGVGQPPDAGERKPS